MTDEHDTLRTADQIDLRSVLDESSVSTVSSHPPTVELERIRSAKFKFGVITSCAAGFILLVCSFFMVVYFDPSTSEQTQTNIITGFSTALGAAIGLFATARTTA